MTMVPGQVVTNLSPSLQRGVARPGSTGDLFTRLLAAPDPGPVLVEDLPDVVKTAINPEHSVEQVRSCYHNCTTFTKPIHLLMSSKIKNLARHFLSTNDKSFNKQDIEKYIQKKG